MKVINFILICLTILIGISIWMGYDGNVPLLLLVVAGSQMVNGWDRYRKNRGEAFVLFLLAVFLMGVAINLVE